jgi:hypothetical protein
MFDQLTRLVPLSMPAAEIGVSTETLAEWARNGRRAPNGVRVKLRAVKAGDWRTCKLWLDEFFEKLSEPADRPAATPSGAGTA